MAQVRRDRGLCLEDRQGGIPCPELQGSSAKIRASSRAAINEADPGITARSDRARVPPSRLVNVGVGTIRRRPTRWLRGS
jgi:hypothetical protein